MLESLVYYKTLPFCTVLMDSWYATKDLMQYIDKLGKYYYCPLKKNRLVDDTAGVEKSKSIEALTWSKAELKQGKIIKIKAFPQDKKVKLFRVIVSTDLRGIYCNQQFNSRFYGGCTRGVWCALEN